MMIFAPDAGDEAAFRFQQRYFRYAITLISISPSFRHFLFFISHFRRRHFRLSTAFAIIFAEPPPFRHADTAAITPSFTIDFLLDAFTFCHYFRHSPAEPLPPLFRRHAPPAFFDAPRHFVFAISSPIIFFAFFG
jgi:hypothetical protein